MPININAYDIGSYDIALYDVVQAPPGSGLTINIVDTNITIQMYDAQANPLLSSFDFTIIGNQLLVNNNYQNAIDMVLLKNGWVIARYRNTDGTAFVNGAIFNMV